MPHLIEKIPYCVNSQKILVNRFEQNSQLVQQGDLFFALKGKKTDGHNFLKEIAQKKAKAAVVSKDYKGPDFGLVLFYSQDVLLSMQALAKEKFFSMKGKTIAITGSIGKTTTKEFCSSILSMRHNVFKSPKSCNSQIAFPLNLLNLTKEFDYYILEMGMSLKGELDKLISIAPPYLALMTKIGLSHSENFPGGLKEIAQEKSKIFSQTFTKHKIFNHQLLTLNPFIEGISFSLYSHQAHFFLSIKERCIYEKNQPPQPIDLPFYETHILENLIGAIAIARTFQMSWQDILLAMKNLPIVERRFEKKNYAGITFIDDCYNASMDSMIAALDNLPTPKTNRKKIAVLGPMKELGAFSSFCHKEVLKKALDVVDEVLLLGEEWTLLKKSKNIFCSLNKKDVIAHIKTFIQPGDVLLIKGSRSVQMEEIIDDLFGDKYSFH